MSKRKPTTIKRKSAKPAARTRQVKKTSRLGASLSRFVAALPVRSETIDRAITACTFILIFGTVAAVAIFAGVPSFVGTQIAHAAGRAGFQVKKVEVKGIDRVESLDVYSVALKEHATAMPLVDLSRIRTELMQQSWIADARVSRRLPDTLVVDVVERQPAAIWQHQGKLSLVDEGGVVLEPVDPRAAPDLPLVLGANANMQVADLKTLMEAAPAMSPRVAGATWVGNRRWDLRFESGEILSLPEGQDLAQRALQYFARVDGTRRLLGRGFVRIDLRDQRQMYVRLPGKDFTKPVEAGQKTSDASH